MSRASRWAARGSEAVRVDRPRFESDTVEAWVTDKGELVIWHKPVLGTKDAPMTPPETALALAEWITSTFSSDLVDATREMDTVAFDFAPERVPPIAALRQVEVGGQARWVV